MFVNLIIILRCGIIINIKCVGINVKYKRTVEIEVKIGERIKIKLWLKLIAYGIINESQRMSKLFCAFGIFTNSPFSNDLKCSISFLRSFSVTLTL